MVKKWCGNFLHNQVQFQSMELQMVKEASFSDTSISLLPLYNLYLFSRLTDSFIASPSQLLINPSHFSSYCSRKYLHRFHNHSSSTTCIVILRYSWRRLKSLSSSVETFEGVTKKQRMQLQQYKTITVPCWLKFLICSIASISELAILMENSHSVTIQQSRNSSRSGFVLF